MPTSKRALPPLPLDDERRIAPAAAELAESLAESRKCTAAVVRLVRDIDNDDVSFDDVELEPATEADTLVRRTRAHLADLRRAHR